MPTKALVIADGLLGRGHQTSINKAMKFPVQLVDIAENLRQVVREDMRGRNAAYDPASLGLHTLDCHWPLSELQPSLVTRSRASA